MDKPIPFRPEMVLIMAAPNVVAAPGSEECGIEMQSNLEPDEIVEVLEKCIEMVKFGDDACVTRLRPGAKH